MTVLFLSACLGFLEPVDPVGAALHAELSGDNAKRTALLQSALRGEQAPERAHWQLGEVLVGKVWKSAAENPGTPPDADYLRRRQQCRDAAADHWKLARWCKAKGLKAEYDAELRIVVRLDPSFVDAQKALGRKLRNGVWLTDAEWNARKATYAEAIAADRKWTTIFRSLGSSLESLPVLDDPLAIPALEREVSSKSEKGAKLAVRRLSEMTHYAAVGSLVRHAVLSNWATVRKDAAESLKTRSIDQTMPLFLQYFRTKESGYAFVPGYGDVWYWQDLDATHVGVVSFLGHGSVESVGDVHVGATYRTGPGADAVYVDAPRNARANGSIIAEPEPGAVRTILPRGRGMKTNSVDDVHESKMGAKMAASVALDDVLKANAVESLKTMTGVDFGDDGKAWNRFWAQVGNASDVEDETPTRAVTVETTRIAMLECHSCFAAGTPVWTDRGLCPIDRLQLGDKVLSQNTETGELAYKPVLFRTLIARTNAVNLIAAGEKIVATRIHPFWVSGAGWKMAQETAAGDLLRAVSGSVKLEGRGDASPVQAYNLEVADFGTYFVGKTGLLVHDRTPMKEAARPLPGMAPRSTPATAVAAR